MDKKETRTQIVTRDETHWESAHIHVATVLLAMLSKKEDGGAASGGSSWSALYPSYAIFFPFFFFDFVSRLFFCTLALLVFALTNIYEIKTFQLLLIKD